MKNKNISAVPVQGVIRAKLDQGFDLRLEGRKTCFVPIERLLGASADERYERWDQLNIGDLMTVLITGASRRPMASEVAAREYMAENELSEGAEVEFFVVRADASGVAVNLLAPPSACGLSAFIFRNKIDDDDYAELVRDCLTASYERIGRRARVARIARNERRHLNIKLTMKNTAV